MCKHNGVCKGLGMCRSKYGGVMHACDKGVLGKVLVTTEIGVQSHSSLPSKFASCCIYRNHTPN